MKKFVIWLLSISLVIITAGCTGISKPSQTTISNLLVIPDTSGGITATYMVWGTAGHNSIRLQRINAEGITVWNSTLYENANSRANIVGMVEGTNNEVLVAWDVLNPEDSKGSSYQFDHSSLVKADSQGQIKWNKDFSEEGMQVVSDKMGGAIVAWATKGNYHALRLDTQGNELWNSPISKGGDGLKLASNENGEAFFLWDNRENPYFVVQKLGADGKALWGQEGMPEGVRIKYLATNLQQEPQIASDRAGGAIITWAEVLEQQASYVWILSIEASGHVLWYTPVHELANSVHPKTEVVSDDSGGGIVVWEDHRQGMAIYAQKVDAEGKAIWQKNGLPIITNLPQQSPHFKAVRDGTGGAIIAWIDGDGKLYVQDIDANGNKKWGETGVVVSSAARLPVILMIGNESGIVLGWQTGNPDHLQDALVQKIDSTGKLLWGAEGIKLSQ